MNKRLRGGRRKKRKQHVQEETDWDELYDPTRPTNVDEYLRSDEKIDEVREWKTLLYRHKKRPEESDISDDEDSRPAPASMYISVAMLLLYHNLWVSNGMIRSIRAPAFIRFCSSST